jgi:hypothetical protein
MHTTFHLHVCTPPRYTSLPLALPQQPDPALPHLSVVPLPSPRTIQIQHTRAMRRGAAWPLAERPSSCLTARSAVSRTDRRPHRRACMGRRAPQAPSAGTRFGVPAGTRSAWWPRISGAGPALSACPVLSSILCPVSCVLCPVSTRPVSTRPVSTRAMSTRPASSVRVSAVRCGRPGTWASGVRYPGVPRLLCPNRVSSSSAPMRRAATRRGRPESAWSPRTVSTTGWSSARVGA